MHFVKCSFATNHAIKHSDTRDHINHTYLDHWECHIVCLLAILVLTTGVNNGWVYIRILCPSNFGSKTPLNGPCFFDSKIEPTLEDWFLKS